jgi:glycosyltransferase involved in cell wall biosynthesis
MDSCEDYLAAAGYGLLELDQRCRPSLIHLNGHAQAALAWRAPFLIVGHSCMLSWSRALGRDHAARRLDAYRRRVCAGLRAAQAVVCPTAWMLAQLLGHYEVRFEGLVINHARRASEYFPSPKSGIVLGAGHLWDEATNLAALDAVGDRLPWPVLLAGPVCEFERRRVPTRHVDSLGPLGANELAWWMSHSAIFAHPARYEPFVLAPLEAARSGCALVLGDIPSLREVWGDAAVYVDPDDHDALAATLRELIADPFHRNTMAARAQVRAQRYSVPRMVAAYHNLYLELVHAEPRLDPGSSILHDLHAGPRVAGAC